MNPRPDKGFQVSRAVPGTLAVAGVLDFATAAEALESLRAAVADKAITRIDLGDVVRSDSAGLSCMLALKAGMAATGRLLQIVNVPAGMRALAQVCEVEALIA